MDHLVVKNFGPIKEANVTFGDLTILVGPQASGKSTFLQLTKLVKDNNHIADTLNKYGYAWQNSDEFLERYLGEGYSRVWTERTEVEADEIKVRKEQFGRIVADAMGYDYQNVFLVPAQRVLTLENGYPKPFNGFGVGDPFVIKSFSEEMRQYVEAPQGYAYFGSPSGETGFSAYRKIFYEGQVLLDTSGPRKRFMLDTDGLRLPFMAWSSGQKEFMPLYIALAMLRKPMIANDKFALTKTIIVEEPEMGLHPNAIKFLIFAFLQLIEAGYKVIVSTHSPILIEFAWAFHMLKSSNASHDALLEIFDFERSILQNEQIRHLARSITKRALNSEIRTYCFDHASGIVKDISTLDASSDDVDISEWGGLSSFATRAGEIVAKNIPL